MNFEKAVKWLYEELPMFSKVGESAYNPGLKNIKTILDKLGNPQNKYKTIHVAGTNGKGSSSHMLASVLQEQGYKVGLFTSPHLKSFTERIKVNGQECNQPFVVDFIADNQQNARENNFSFFEFTTAMAFDYFCQEKVDFAVIEVGLGGRLDATNVISPILSIITNVHFDHQAILGNTLEKIAVEKGGIIKPLVPVVLGQMREESRNTLMQLTKERNSPVFEFDSKFYFKNYKLDLKGNYQQQNLKTVLTAVYVLTNQLNIEINEENLKKGLENVVKNTQLRGRWEKLAQNPLIMCDTAHNEDGIKQVSAQIKEQKFEQLHLVLGFVEDKDFDTIIDFFPKEAQYYFCEPNSSRKLSIEKIKQKIGNQLNAQYFNAPKEALENAKQKASTNDFIFVGGSNFVVAEIL